MNPGKTKVEADRPIPVIRNYRISHIADVISNFASQPDRRDLAMAICHRFDTAGLLTLPVKQVLELLEEVAVVSGIDDLGLKVGARYHPADWGAYGYLFLNSPTVLQALKSWVQVTREEQQGAHARLEFVKEGIRLEYAVIDPPDVRRRQDAEMTLAVLVQAIRVIAGAAVNPEAVHFEHSRPRMTATHRLLFRAPVSFGMGVNAIILDHRLASTPVPNADAQLLGVISKFLGDSRSVSAREVSIIDLVEVAVRPLISQGKVNLNTVSRRIGMSSRTVQRRLSEAGFTFEQCADRVRRRIVEELLKEGELEIKEIAYQIGMSGGPALSRAYKRWAGIPPVAFRRLHQEGQLRP